MGALSALEAEGERPRKRDGSDRRTWGDVQMTSENIFDLSPSYPYPSFLPLQMSYVHGPMLAPLVKLVTCRGFNAAFRPSVVHATESRFYNGGSGGGESQGSTSMIDVGGEISNAPSRPSERMCRPGICTSAQTRCIQSLIPLVVALSSGTP